MAKSKGIDIDGLFRALGDPTRRGDAEQDKLRARVGLRIGRAPGITLTAVAQHLQILEGSRLVRTEKLGRIRTCQIDPAGFDMLENWIRGHRSVWEQRLDRLGDLLAGKGT